MSKIDVKYHKLLDKILKKGYTYEDLNRKGVNRIQIPRYVFEYDFKHGFPAISTKKLAWKSVVAELIWILRGDTNIKYLVDNGVNIWSSDYEVWKNKGLNTADGDLGRIYGYQLRNFGGKFDQLKWIIDTMKNNPLATKKTVSFINPCDKDHQALSPCHTGFKILIENNESPFKFTLQWEQDSVDTFLG